MVKPVSAFVLSAVSKETLAHALGTDPTVIERIDAGLMLPFELSPAWVFWLVFGLCIVQNLKGTAPFFIGVASGIIVASILGPISLDVSRLALILGLLVSAWMCFGRKTNPRLSALVMFILSALSMWMVFSVHADLSEDRLIRSIAAISMLLSASFFGGLFKQIDRWFPKQTPIGIRILSSWVVALIAIQFAMGMVSR